MANGCTLFGGLIPNVYIDRVFLEESVVAAHPNGTTPEIQTPKITVSVKVVDQLNANGTYSLLDDALSPTQSLDLKKYIKINCIATTSTDATDYIEDLVIRPANLGMGPSVFFSGWSTAFNFSDPDIRIVPEKTLGDFKCTYTNSDGNIELLASFTFTLEENSILEHLTIFTFAQFDTDTLISDFSLGADSLPDSIKRTISTPQQELVIKNSQVTSMMKGYKVQGATSVERMGVDIEPPSISHVHAYNDVDNNGNGWTEYAVHPDEPNIRHRHQIINGVVQSAQSECWREDITDPQSCESLYQASQGWGTYPLSGVGPHDHQLEEDWVLVSNVQDFRIRDELDILTAEFTNLMAEHIRLPEQKDILAPFDALAPYFSDIFVTKDSDKKARFFIAFDQGRYALENSKYVNIISKMSEASQQKIIDNAQLTRFILSRRQTEENIFFNRLGGPSPRQMTNAVEKPVVFSIADSSLREVAVILPEQTTVPNSRIRYFTGIDPEMAIESNGNHQYMMDVELLDGFIPLMTEVYSNLSEAAAEYQKYVALTQLPGTMADPDRGIPAQEPAYDVESRKFTVRFQSVALPWAAMYSLSNIVEIYLNTLSYFIDFTRTELLPNSNSTFTTNWALTYTDKILNLISPDTGGVDGVLLFNDLLSLLLSQINNILKVGHSGGGIEDTLSNQPSNRTSAFQTHAMDKRETFDNTIGARFLNEAYVDNISADVSDTQGLHIYSIDDLTFAASTVYTNEPSGVDLNSFWTVGEDGTTLQLPGSGEDEGTCATEETVTAYAWMGTGPGGGVTGDYGPDAPDAPPVLPDLPPEFRFPPIVITGLRDADPTTPEEDPLELKFDVLVAFQLSAANSPFGEQILLRAPIFKEMFISQLTPSDTMTNAATDLGIGGPYYLCRQPKEATGTITVSVDTGTATYMAGGEPVLVGPVPEAFSATEEIVIDKPIEVVDCYFLLTPGAPTRPAAQQHQRPWDPPGSDMMGRLGQAIPGSFLVENVDTSALTAAQRAAAKYGESPEGAPAATATGTATTTTSIPGLGTGASETPSQGAPPPSQTQPRSARRGRLLTRRATRSARSPMTRKRRGGY